MATKKQWLAVLKAIAMSKATWKLMSAVAVFLWLRSWRANRKTDWRCHRGRIGSPLRI
jgi:hypothetical protein